MTDYSRFPTKDLQIDWLKIYLTEFNGQCPTQKELETLYVHVNQFVLLTHIMWGSWALIQAEHSSIDFDYLWYEILYFYILLKS